MAEKHHKRKTRVAPSVRRARDIFFRCALDKASAFLRRLPTRQNLSSWWTKMLPTEATLLNIFLCIFCSFLWIQNPARHSRHTWLYWNDTIPEQLAGRGLRKQYSGSGTEKSADINRFQPNRVTFQISLKYNLLNLINP